MSNSCCGVGALSKLAIGLMSGTATRMDFIDFQPQVVKTLSNAGTKAIRGTLDQIDTDVGEGLLHVKFRTRMYLTPAKMAVLLPCLGFTITGGAGPLGDTLPYSKVIVGAANAPEDTYANCVPTDFVIMGQKGSDPIMIDIGWLGQTYASATAGTFFTSQTSPAMTEGTIFPFGSSTAGGNYTTLLTIAGTTYYMPQVRLSVNYNIVSDTNNSVTVTNACPTRHDVTLASSVMYSTCDSTTGLFTGPVSGNITGGVVVLSFTSTSPSASATFTIANGKFIARPSRLVKNDFNRLPLQLQGFSQVQAGALTAALTAAYTGS